MRRTTVKFIIGGVILLSAAAYLAYAGMKEGWVSYHLQVDDFLSNPKYQGERVRLCGQVALEGLVSNPGRLRAEFTLLGQTQRLPVVYSGVIPDLFKGGCEVVVEGRRDTSGVFQANLMMMKCASKYQSAEHTQKAGKTS